MAALVDAVSDAGVRPPGVIGGRPEVDAAADAWVARHGGSFATRRRQGVYELRTVRDAGTRRARRAAPPKTTSTCSTRGMRRSCPRPCRACGGPRHAPSPAGAGARRGRVLAVGGRRRARLDDRREPRAAGRRAGRARLHAAAASRPRLRDRARRTRERRGPRRRRRACFLHTDLANPTSNAIYMRIGYEWACEAADYPVRALVARRRRRRVGPRTGTNAISPGIDEAEALARQTLASRSDRAARPAAAAARRSPAAAAGPRAPGVRARTAARGTPAPGATAKIAARKTTNARIEACGVRRCPAAGCVLLPRGLGGGSRRCPGAHGAPPPPGDRPPPAAPA